MTNEIMNSTTFVKAVLAGTVVCFAFFSFDVVIDLREHIMDNVAYSGAEMFHLVFEAISVLTLGSCILVTSRYLAKLTDEERKAKSSLHALREDFDGFVGQRFAKWTLSPAESDVALLLLRGLSVSDIAELRDTRSGTVKVQAHNIFRKSGVNSRVEFTSLFMEEFIDIGLDK